MPLLDDVPCPFCGLGCDDLTLRDTGNSFTVVAGGCPRSRVGFGQPAGVPAARIAGKAVSTEAAVAAAGRILGAARQPLVTGLATDLAGARAALAVARQCDGIVDHLHGESALYSALAMQSSGGMGTTMAEIKNRADLVILVGAAEDVAPRFVERCLAHRQRPFLTDVPRHVVLLGPSPEIPESAGDSRGLRWEHLYCEPDDLLAAVGALQCMMAGRSLDQRDAGRLPVEQLRGLADAMSQVRYGAVVWVPPPATAGHGDLLIEAIQSLLQELNSERRWGGLGLGGSEGAATVQEVCTWTSGYPGRIRYRACDVHYEPWLLDGKQMLTSGEVDCMLWVGGLEGEHGPPETTAHSIILAPPGTHLAREPEVYLPVGVPGLDHAGTAVRCDHVVSLPLRQLRSDGPLSAAYVLNAILKTLSGRQVTAC